MEEDKIGNKKGVMFCFTFLISYSFLLPSPSFQSTCFLDDTLTFVSNHRYVVERDAPHPTFAALLRLILELPAAEHYVRFVRSVHYAPRVRDFRLTEFHKQVLHLALQQRFISVSVVVCFHAKEEEWSAAARHTRRREDLEVEKRRLSGRKDLEVGERRLSGRKDLEVGERRLSASQENRLDSVREMCVQSSYFLLYFLLFSYTFFFPPTLSYILYRSVQRVLDTLVVEGDAPFVATLDEVRTQIVFERRRLQRRRSSNSTRRSSFKD